MLSDGLKRVFGLSQLFMRRNKQDEIVLMIAKVADDFLVSGKLDFIQEFMDRLQHQRFTVGKVVIDEHFHFNGCEIQQSRTGILECRSQGTWIDCDRNLSAEKGESRGSCTRMTRKPSHTGLWLEPCSTSETVSCLRLRCLYRSCSSVLAI